jgi:DNA-binding beta-propeller fold protein YncE
MSAIVLAATILVVGVTPALATARRSSFTRSSPSPSGSEAYRSTAKRISYHFGTPDALVSRGGIVWVVNPSNGSVTELVAATDRLVRIISGKRYHFSYPDSMAVDRAHVWLSNLYGYSVTEIDKSTGKLVRVISGVRYHLVLPTAVTSDGDHVWIASGANNSVTEVAASTGALIRVLTSTSFGFNHPAALALDGSHLWVAREPGVRRQAHQLLKPAPEHRR